MKSTKSFWKKSAEIAVLGALLVVVTLPVTYKSLAQVAPIRGEVSAGVYENLKSDGSGHLLINSGLSSAITSTYTLSNVSVSTTAGTLSIVPASSTRKVLLIQNTNTASNLYIGLTSPVSSTTGITLVPGASFFTSYNAPTNGWVASAGTSTVVVTVGDGQ